METASLTRQPDKTWHAGYHVEAQPDVGGVSSVVVGTSYHPEWTRDKFQGIDQGAVDVLQRAIDNAGLGA